MATQVILQGTLLGGPAVKTGNRIEDALLEIAQEHPEIGDDDHYWAALFLELRFPQIALADLRSIVAVDWRDNLRERIRQARDFYPYTPEEKARRMARGKGGPPG